MILNSSSRVQTEIPAAMVKQVEEFFTDLNAWSVSILGNSGSPGADAPQDAPPVEREPCFNCPAGLVHRIIQQIHSIDFSFLDQQGLQVRQIFDPMIF